MNRETQKSLGQYFTPAFVADFMIGLSTVKKTAQILEPSSGQGVFLKGLSDKGHKNTLGFEIDKSLKQISKSKVIFESFLSQKFGQKFDLVIGNPPYIRWKNLPPESKKELEHNPRWQKYFNSLCDYLYIFILQSIELLNEGGELIFITPEYWINTKHSQSLRNYMVEHGYFEVIYHFNETPIFDNVASSIMVFKFIKSAKKAKSQTLKVIKYNSTKKLNSQILEQLKKKVAMEDAEYLTIEQFRVNERWLMCSKEVRDELSEYEEKCQTTLGELCDIGNGMVSGLDKAFQLPDKLELNKKEVKAILNVVKAKDLEPYFFNRVTKYIFLSEQVSESQLKTGYPYFYAQLKGYKDQLVKRYNYNRQINYWNWVFLRSYKLFKQDVPKIFVPCKERISNKDYFRFALVEPGIFPTQDVTALVPKPRVKENIYFILALLNNHRVFNWLKYNGVVKGNIVEFSEEPLKAIPIRVINWKNNGEVALHNQIAGACREYLETKSASKLKQLNILIEKLF